MSKQVLDPKTGTYAKRVSDMRDFIEVKDSVPNQLLKYLEAELGDGLYGCLLDMWLAVPVHVANWCFDQIVNRPDDGTPLTTELMAHNLQTAISTAYEIVVLYKRSEGN